MFLKRRSVRIPLAALGTVALLVMSRAQEPTTSIPFLTTPFIGPASFQTGITLLVRQADSTYAQLQFAEDSPYTLLSSMTTLAGIVASGGKALEALPPAPPNVGPSAQLAAIADFTGDGSPGVAFIDVARDLASIDVYLGTPSFLFKGHSTYALPGPAGTVIAADFNKDGKPDLAVSTFIASGSSPGLAILLNKGDGTFGTAVAYGPNVTPSAFAVLDINHDGLPDIIEAGSTSSGASSISVLIGKGDGTFASGATYPVSTTLSLTIADFNGDGNPDVAAVNVSGGCVILLGKGDGTFNTGATVVAPAGANYIAAGDLNGDGKMDLAIASRNSQAVATYLGKGDGTFTMGASYVVSYDPDSLVLTDYNHDGKLDIIAGIGDQRGIGPGYDSTNTDILLGNGDGTFQGAATSVGPTNNASFLVTGDFDGDGKLDAITDNQGSGQLYIYKGNGNGTFQTAAPIVSLDTNGQTGPIAAAAGDFNGDGKLDLATADFYADSVSVVLNSGSGFQTPVSFASGGSDPVSIAAADFDGDGKLDLAVANVGEGPSDTIVANVVVFHGVGDGSFTTSATLTAGGAPMYVRVADVNGDGHPDLIVADGGANYGQSPGGIDVFLNNGKGGFAPAVTYTVSNSPSFVAVGDVNGDGKQDLVVVTEDTNIQWQIAVLLGNGNGTFQQPSLIPTGFGADQVVIHDFDGDGKPDLVVSHCCGDTDMTYLAGHGDGTFASEVHFSGGPSPQTLVAADLNGDGKTDLLIGANATGGITTLLNKGAPAALVATTVNGASFSPDLTVAPDSIASIFGSDLANQTASAGSTLGTTLAGTSVSITDSAGTTMAVPLFFVSAIQTNVQIPAGLAVGTASVQVTSGDGTLSKGTVTIAPVAPGIFAASNLALAYSLRSVNGALQYTPTVSVNAAGQFVAAPIALSSSIDTYLVLFGTGIRGAALSDVSAKIGTATVAPVYAGAQPQFAGEDQVNILIPATLAGSGDNTVTITAAGKGANAVHITIQ